MRYGIYLEIGPQLEGFLYALFWGPVAWYAAKLAFHIVAHFLNPPRP